MDFYIALSCGSSLVDPDTCKHRLGIVIVDEVGYKLVDIGMRMLTPHEFLRAQGFPDDYVIAPLYDGRPFTKAAQIRMRGNSVCPHAAEAVVRPNIPATARKPLRYDAPTR